MPTSYQKFYEAIREPETRKTYEIYLNRFLEYSKTDHDGIINLKQTDTEELVFNYIIHLKNLTETTGKPNPNSYNTMISPIKLFLDMNDILLNWIKLKKIYPPRKPTANQLPYSDKDVKELLSATTNLRNKAFIHFLASTGCRVGAIPNLDICDIERIENGAIVILYRDTLEEYRSCLTLEALQSLEKYLKQRLNRSSDDPLFTTKNNVSRLSQVASRDLIRNIRKQAKLEVDNGRKSTKGKSQNHAFRKRFEICLAKADIQSKFIEYMMGHYEKQDKYYFKGISNEDIWNQFKRAIPGLMLDKTEQMVQTYEIEIQELSNNFKSEYKEKIENLEEQLDLLKKETAEKTIGRYHSDYGDDLKKEFRDLDIEEVEEYNEAVETLDESRKAELCIKPEKIELNSSEKRLIVTRELKRVKNSISLIEGLESEGLKILEKPEFSCLKELLDEKEEPNSRRREFSHQDILNSLKSLKNQQIELEKLLKK